MQPARNLPTMVLSKLFTDFFNSERVGGILLLLCTMVSVVLANSAIGENYIAFWHQKWDLTVGPVSLNYSIEHWINDGLMAIFFLLVGLEIERELYIGELSDIRNAATPVAAAVGGMFFPALIYLLFNRGTATQSGFGIPMATDIAFALGMLALLGKRVPASLKVFLTALAIIDDLGAIGVIAIFYSKGISWLYLSLALGIFFALLLLGRLRVFYMSVYLVGGVLMWYCMLKSGVHATISGVLLAFAIPFGRKKEANLSFRLQHFLHKPVAFFVMPVFALANTALFFHEGWIHDLQNPNSLGIMLGLFLGKPIGVLLFSAMVVKWGFGKMPDGIRRIHLSGLGMLAGIGFTMSIFISNLAFSESLDVQVSKIAVLAASLLSGVSGLLLLRFSLRSDPSLTPNVN